MFVTCKNETNIIKSVKYDKKKPKASIEGVRGKKL